MRHPARGVGALSRGRSLRPDVEYLEGRVVPSTIMVMNTNDSGPDSLRAAIEQANMDPAQDTIDLTSIAGTIVLSSVLPDLSTNLTVAGPGASVLSVARDSAPDTPAFRIFAVTAGSDVTISRLTIRGGRADGSHGGGIDNLGTLTIIASTLSGNAAIYSHGASDGVYGGGINNSGTMTVTDSTLSGNSAYELDIGGSRRAYNGAAGGGIYNSGKATFTDSTLSGNSAGTGGGILNRGIMTVTNSTLSGNSADLGGGIVNLTFLSTVNPGAELSATTSLFASNAGGNLLSLSEEGDAFVSLGHNLFSDAPDVALDSTDLVNTDPLLGPLTDNGGPTLTHALLPGSPAIDAGTPVVGVTTDQRGIPRPQGAAPDIGAFESRGFALSIVSGNSQSTPALSAFPDPLLVRVTSPFGERVVGGRVTFDATATGDSATLGNNPATIGADGQAAVTLAADGRGGTYTVTARATGGNSVAFTLANIATPPVTGVSTPPRVTGIVAVTHVKKGITAITLGFSEALDRSSAGTASFYALAAGVKRRHKLAFTTGVKVGGVSYDGNARAVTLRLSKATKGPLQVTTHGGILGANGATSGGDFTAVVK